MMKMMRFLLGLLALLILASTVPAPAQGVGQLYWQCGNPLTSPSTQTTWCPVSTQYPLPSGGSGAVISSAITRPSNTTTYTANTGWCGATTACGTVFSFPAVCRSANGAVLIPEIDIYSSANPTTKLQGVLWLFSSLPGTIISDNANFNIASADFAALTGGSTNGLPFTLGTIQASGAANSGVSLTTTTTEASCTGTALYGMVQVVNAYVPVSGEILTVKLSTVGVN